MKKGVGSVVGSGCISKMSRISNIALKSKSLSTVVSKHLGCLSAVLRIQIRNFLSSVKIRLTCQNPDFLTLSTSFFISMNNF